MKKILIAITLTLTTMAIFAQKQKPMNIYDFPITRVIDGDTVAFQATFLPPPLKQELSIRVFGILPSFFLVHHSVGQIFCNNQGYILSVQNFFH